MSGIARVAVIGSGVIGSGWAARFLANGLDVIATDPAPDGEARMRASVANAWPALEQRGLAEGASPDRLAFSSKVADAVSGADFVQEAAPEDEKLKCELLASIDAATPARIVIASSSSGLLPTRIQADCAHPERVLIGHPFNPVYLLPLVEIVGGERTGSEAKRLAGDFYRSIGMRPLEVRTEIEGYIGNRLQEAIWREALHMVADGVATTEEIDAAITLGPGLRWAFMGPFLTYHTAGGAGGMAHVLEHFGPSLELPWTKLEAPKMTDDLSRQLIDGTRAQSAGKSVAELERARDECLIRIQDAIAKHWPLPR
jgi:carnitine 3-dehydrogenase